MPNYRGQGYKILALDMSKYPDAIAILQSRAGRAGSGPLDTALEDLLD